MTVTVRERHFRPHHNLRPSRPVTAATARAPGRPSGPVTVQVTRCDRHRDCQWRRPGNPILWYHVGAVSVLREAARAREGR